MNTQEERLADYISGLKKLIRFLESEKGKQLDFFPYLNITVYKGNKEEFKKQVKLLGKCKKSFGEHYATAEANFSKRVSIQVSCNRETICEKIVTGTKDIPAETIHYPARTEEIVEWKCNDKAFTK